MARRYLLLLWVLGIAGCAGRPAPAARPAQHLTITDRNPTTAPADPKWGLTLEQIGPPLTWPTSRPSTQPSQKPPIEAVRLFAQARVALLDGRRYEATQLLQKAVALDPASFELHQSLGNAYAFSEDLRAIDQWEQAASIEPDHLSLQVVLARGYLAEGKTDRAVEHLRLALQTADYSRGDPAAAEADFLLARSFQDQGYDRAALQLYERLLGRLQNLRTVTRINPQVAALLAHPDTLALHIAALYEKHGSYAAAVSLLTALSAREPDNFQLQARLARDLAAAGRRDEASELASKIVGRFRGDRDSLALLREITGNDVAATNLLLRLHRQYPQDRQLLYASIDLLAAQRRTADAGKLLADAARQWPDDLLLLRRQVDLLRIQKDLSGAVKLIVSFLARRPDRELEIVPIWDGLLRPSAYGSLRLADVQALHVPTDAEPARLLLLAHSAESAQHDLLAREALRRAIAASPVFAPAWRQMLASIWADVAHTMPQKVIESTRLADEASAAGTAALADELRGRALLDQGRRQESAEAFARAIRAGDRSAELYLNFAGALYAGGDADNAESLLWKVMSDHPMAGEAYLELYAIYQKQGNADQAHRVISAWLSADPDNPSARRLQAREAIRQRHFTEAEQILLKLLEDHDSDPDVLAAVQRFYFETDRAAVCAAKLQQRFATEPWNLMLGRTLAETYAQQQRTAEAVVVLDRLQAAVARDPDLLYVLAGVYARVGANRQSDQVLQQILKLDPASAMASNDLGYSWAERGENLTQAEGLVRRALDAEPDNPSFLDSMGWVLYKRGRFDEALRNLARAANPADQTDPIVLDHLGDTLYRLGERTKAAQEWRQAARRLSQIQDEDRDELRRLRVQLPQKQQQLDAGQPVSVAPIARK